MKPEAGEHGFCMVLRRQGEAQAGLGGPEQNPDSAARHMGGPGRRWPMCLGLTLLIYKIEGFDKDLNQGMD